MTKGTGRVSHFHRDEVPLLSTHAWLSGSSVREELSDVRDSPIVLPESFNRQSCLGMRTLPYTLYSCKGTASTSACEAGAEALEKSW